MHLRQFVLHKSRSKVTVWLSLRPMASQCIQFKLIRLFRFRVCFRIKFLNCFFFFIYSKFTKENKKKTKEKRQRKNCLVFFFVCLTLAYWIATQKKPTNCSNYIIFYVIGLSIHVNGRVCLFIKNKWSYFALKCRPLNICSPSALSKYIRPKITFTTIIANPRWQKK